MCKESRSYRARTFCPFGIPSISKAAQRRQGKGDDGGRKGCCPPAPLAQHRLAPRRGHLLRCRLDVLDGVVPLLLSPQPTPPCQTIYHPWQLAVAAHAGVPPTIASINRPVPLSHALT